MTRRKTGTTLKPPGRRPLEAYEESDTGLESLSVAQAQQYAPDPFETAGNGAGASLESADLDVEDSSEQPTAAEIATEAAGPGEIGGIHETTPGQDLELPEFANEALLETSRAEAQDEAGGGPLLDAWYADFADDATRALILQQPRMTETAMEVVIGADDRVRVTNTTTYPWRCICALRITAKDGSRWIGTGWLAGNRTVITAGHCVYLHSRGGWASSIEVIPGANGAGRPFGSVSSSVLRSVKGWTQDKQRSHDYGAIILPRGWAHAGKLGYFGFANLGMLSLLGLNVNLSGYPGDKPDGTQWWHARRITLATPRTIVYNIDTAGGQSGSPVWRLKDGQRHCVGIHTNGSVLGNSATRIVAPVFDNIKKWKDEGA